MLFQCINQTEIDKLDSYFNIFYLLSKKHDYLIKHLALYF